MGWEELLDLLGTRGASGPAGLYSSGGGGATQTRPGLGMAPPRAQYQGSELAGRGLGGDPLAGLGGQGAGAASGVPQGLEQMLALLARQQAQPSIAESGVPRDSAWGEGSGGLLDLLMRAVLAAGGGR